MATGDFKSWVFRVSSEGVERSNSMQPDTGVGKVEQQGEYKLYNHCKPQQQRHKLETPVQCAAGRTFSGKVVEELLSDAAPRIRNLAVLLSQGKKGNGINHDEKYYNARVLLLAESEKWHGWRFELQEISHSR